MVRHGRPGVCARFLHREIEIHHHNGSAVRREAMLDRTTRSKSGDTLGSVYYAIFKDSEGNRFVLGD